MKSHKNTIYKAWILVSPVILTLSYASITKITKDPFYKSFFEKTQIIMTKNEIKTYKSLPDIETKEKFIEEVWKIRDLDLSTDENEAKIEFYERVDYANRWFWGRTKSRGPNTAVDAQKDLGWKTDRGEIYIVLGPPDSIMDANSFYFEKERSISTRRYGEELWYYSKYSLKVHFSRGRINFRYTGTGLHSAMEDAKLEMIKGGALKNFGKMLRFDVKFKDHTIFISIPATMVQFKESDGKLISEFKVKITVFLNQKEFDQINKTECQVLSEEEIFQIDEIQIEVSLDTNLEGKYDFEIIIEDLMAISPSQYKKHVSHNFKLQ